MDLADHARWHAIVNMAAEDLEAYLTAVPADAPLVEALRSIRFAQSVDERAAAIRARDRVFRERALAEASAKRAAEIERARVERPVKHAAAGARRGPGPAGPGRCPHGTLLEDCDYPSCATDIEAWTRAAMGRHRGFRSLRTRD